LVRINTRYIGIAMARIVKKISDPYAIEAKTGISTQVDIGVVSRNDAQLIVHGNLVVMGTTTSIQSTDTYITDNKLTLSKGLDPVTAVASSIRTGIEVDRGALPRTAILWNENTKKWQLTNDGTNFTNIATAAGGSGYLTEVVQDLNPQLGGDLDVNGHTLTSFNNIVIAPSGNTQIDSVVQIKQTTAIPAAEIAGYSMLVAGAVNGGGTGLYVINDKEYNQELITKKKAIVYSLIF
jgi:hypothetical protein